MRDFEIDTYHVRVFWVVFMLMVIFLVSGCAERGVLRDKMEHSLERYQDELSYRKAEGAPSRCLALSGGGIRSAFYSLGVMKALSDNGLLDSMDIISSVSGGSYASRWYYDRLFNNSEHASGNIFSDDSLVLNSLFRSPLMNGNFYFDVEDIILNAPLTLIGATILKVIFAPYNALNGYPSFRHLPIMSQFYSRRLVRLFGDAPAGTTNKDPTYLELANHVRVHKLPMYIFNATIRGEGYDETARSKHLFEFTPRYFGSDGYGYLPTLVLARDDKRTFIFFNKLSDLIAVSGAAPDKPSYTAWTALQETLGWQFGREIVANYEQQSGNQKWFWLSDGGHTENLGAFPLIRRGCKNLIIVDAEEDKDYTFEGFRILRHMVEHDLEAKLAVPEIDKHLERFSPPCIWNAKCLPTTTVNWESPVMRGKIQFSDSTTLEVTYLKLSYQTAPLAPDPYRATQNSKTQIKFSEVTRQIAESDNGIFNKFPQYSTWNQFLCVVSSDRCAALFQLGLAHASWALQFTRESPKSSEGVRGGSSFH